MKIKFVSTLILCLILNTAAQNQMLATITDDVSTAFATYHPVDVQFTPAIPVYTVESDFSNVENFSHFQNDFNETQLELLRKNHFVVKLGNYSQLYDVYNGATWDSTPVFVTTDAVLHTYHILYDKILAQIEEEKFCTALNTLNDSLITRTDNLYHQVTDSLSKEALRLNLAFLWVDRLLLNEHLLALWDIPDYVSELVAAELDIINKHEGFEYSPIFGNFSKLDYSQFIPRGHYTKSAKLISYFKAMMWYGWTIFTMQQSLFGSLSERHTLQAVLLTQMLYNNEATFNNWQSIFEPTVFFVGRADDPTINDYIEIGCEVYGHSFGQLSPESLADSTLLTTFMTEAQKLPEPAIPNWIYGTFYTYKGFRFMGQRYIPDSHMFANLIYPFVGSAANQRWMPMGLDIMSILGSDRAFAIADSVYKQTTYLNYTETINAFNKDFSEKAPEEWAQNLYWNWLYSLMPLLYQKSEGYPYFMQTLAWANKELMTALASWAELRHDTILYAKQSMSPCGIPPGPPRSYVEPNPHLYARLQSLAAFTITGLENFGLLSSDMKEKLQLFESLVDFLRKVSIKELQNESLSTAEYENIFCFGKVMEDLVSEIKDPNNPWNKDSDDMAVIADVHTDSNTNTCLEEAVGYPLEIYVIVNEGGVLRITKGAIFSYYEFTQPITARLTDEKWREMLQSGEEPDLPVWLSKFMNVSEKREYLLTESPDNLYVKEFTAIAERDPADQQSFKLEQNYPNPFNSSTSFYYNLDKKEYINISIYDLQGRLVDQLYSGYKNSGRHYIIWNADNISSGVYFIRLSSSNLSLTRKCLYLK
jgi:hypothetical protein